jgi:hypothetical protein
MKASALRTTVLTFALLLAMGLGAWYLFARKVFLIPSPGSLMRATPIPVKDNIDVPAGKLMNWTFSTPDGRTPGLLQGTWHCSGASAGISGAQDDTLVGFTLRGPDDKVLEQLDHPISGNFSLRFEAPGKCTFVFDNGGIIRSSMRKVRIEGTYHPD